MMRVYPTDIALLRFHTALTHTSRRRFSDRVTGSLRSLAVRRIRGEDQHPTSAVVSVRAPKRRARWRLTGRFPRNRSRAHDPLLPLIRYKTGRSRTSLIGRKWLYGLLH